MIPAIRAVVADDEPRARHQLRSLLESEAGVQVVAEAADGAATVAAVRRYAPDLLLLDAHMPDGDGLHVLHQIPADNLPLVIFVSAHEQYAMRAIEARAIDYLMKPFDETRLHAAIERVRVEILKAHEHRLTHRILKSLAGPKSDSTAGKRLAVKAGNRVLLLDTTDIDWIEACGNYVKLRVGSESYLLREGIGRICDRLDPSRFVRIHRSTIVNVQRIKELHPCNNGEYMVILRSGKELSCSRGYRSRLREVVAAP